MAAPLLAVDTPSLLYRAFFALPKSIKGADGKPVNALLGTANMLLQAVADYGPRAVICCFGAEAGAYRVKAFPSYSWWGIYAPTGTPRPIVDRMHAEIKKAVLAPDVTQKFVDQFNMEILTTSPEEFAAYQKSEQDRWFKVIKDNDIKGD